MQPADSGQVGQHCSTAFPNGKERVDVIFEVVWTVTFLLEFAYSSYPSYSSPPSPYPKPEFVPAMPGKTPKCAKDPRLTFCIQPDNYPKHRIVYLLENKMYDVNTFLQDEMRDTYTFEAREPPRIRGYGQPSRPSRYLPPQNISASRPSYVTNSKPSKFRVPQYFKPPPFVSSRSSNFHYSSNSSFSLNSFTSSYPTKYDERHQYTPNSRPTPQSNDGPYPRYPRSGFTTTTAPYQPPKSQHTSMWWRKIHRRGKRQADPGLSELCPSLASYIMPRAAQRVEGDWMFLVNVDDQYKQLVKSETCIQNTCEGACDVPDGFSAICQQQYVQKRLVALDGSGSKLNSDTFWFPSCCICRIRANGG